MRKICVVLVCLLALCGCGGGAGSKPPVTFSGLLGTLTNNDSIARLDVPETAIITSFDPQGGNEDYNHFLRKGPPGWVVLADLKGPGYLSRFWFTGSGDADHRIRFYFDGEKEPRVDTTLGEWCGGKDPFRAPVASEEQYCWFNWVPLPYAKSLIVMAQEPVLRPGKEQRLFYQINYSTYPRGQRVESFSGKVSPDDAKRIEEIRARWAQGGMQDLPPSCLSATKSLALDPGASQALDDLRGPAILHALSITPDIGKLASAVDRERVLRDVVLSIQWDGSSSPSVAVPLGDFFGSVWRRTRYLSAYFGMTNDTFISRFPMPFQSSARISLENQGGQPVSLEVTAGWEPLGAWDPGLGYFHATFSRSGPQDVGRPHYILRTNGKGRYAGCLLSEVTLDRSWWILEGDEVMYRDGKATPFWHGTGLEDYFNGGWYYQNVLARPLHGLVFKAFFRITQYRLHLLDPVLFKSSFSMTFERGPDDASHGWMESTAFYYLDQPVAAAFEVGPAAERPPPSDPMAEGRVMTELLNYERFGDYRGAREYIDEFLQRHPAFPFAAILRLRQLAYVERIDGFDKARPLYEQFMAAEANPAAVEQAKLLLWFHESPSNALVSLYSNPKARLLLDGTEVCASEGPERAVTIGVQVGPGRHGLAIQSGYQRYPDWVQGGLRTHRGFVGTEPSWRYRFNAPDGPWSSADFDDGGWTGVGGTGVKGPPEEPFVWLEPNAFVGMQSAPVGLRATEDWPRERRHNVYRKTVDLP